MPTEEDQPELKVQLLDNRMRAVLSVDPLFPAEQLNERDCALAFNNAGVSLTKELQEQIRQAIARRLENPEEEMVVQVHGQSVVHGQNGWLQWEPGCDPNHIDSTATAEDGTIDHYNQMHFVRVEPNQVLAHLHNATPGTDGYDATDREINARDGKELELLTDDTIIEDANGTYTALQAGTLQFHGNVMRVLTCLTINEHVDFETGNIDFDGDVEIQQGVRDQFTVHATGNVIANGLVEAATIEADGDFEANAGMAAKDKGSIRIGGHVRAKYFNNVCGKVGKDVHVKNEMMHCNLAIRGDLEIKHGSLIGGCTRVTGAVDVSQVGSPSGDKTVVVLDHAPEKSILKAADQYLEEIKEQCQAMRKQLDTLTSAKAGKVASQKEDLTELMCEVPMLEQKIQRIDNKRSQIQDHVDQITKVQLNVSQTLHAGTMIVVDDTGYIFEKTLQGPVSICWDDHRQLVVKNPRTGDQYSIAGVTRTTFRLTEMGDCSDPLAA